MFSKFKYVFGARIVLLSYSGQKKEKLYNSVFTVENSEKLLSATC